MQSLSPNPTNKKVNPLFILLGTVLSLLIVLTTVQMGFSNQTPFQKAALLFIDMDEPAQDDYVEYAEENARPSQGFAEFSRYLQENIHYPEDAPQGKVYIQFIVEKDGTISNASIKDGLSEEWNSQAIEVLQSAPKWIPAKNEGKIVRQLLTLPVNFKP